MASKTHRSIALSLLLLGAVPACAPGGDPSAGSPGTASGAASGQTGGTPSSLPPTGLKPDAQAATCPALAGLQAEQGDLVTRLEAARITPSRSEAFEEPNGTALVGFERAFEQLLLAGPTPGVREDLTSLGFTLTAFHNAKGGAWLVVEDASGSRGGGTFVVNLAPARDMWLEAPHADSDEGTLRQTAEQMVELGARALVVTGSNRCASSVPTPCGSVTPMCGGQFRISDAAHFDRNFFTAAHRALRSAFPDALAVQVHGMDTEGAEAAVVSNGTREAMPTSLSVKLRDALNQRLKVAARAFSCNDPDDAGRFRPLCGTQNVQGGLDNGAANACTEKATRSSERFIHVEQSAELRLGGSEHTLLEALADTVPCTLPGDGLQCPARTASASDCP